MEEQEILRLLKKDVSKGMQIAIDMYGKAVKTICNSILSGYSTQDIEEAVSDTFVGMWKSRDSIIIDNEHSLKSYLYGIARITALNRKRSLAKGKKLEDIDSIQEEASDSNIEQEVIQRYECEILRHLIQNMKSPDREVFIYRYFNQYSIKEIAEKLELKSKTVENKLLRGKARLKKQLIQLGINVM